jgi:NAD(P)-dependent dehydrogenase (short-subunit alcohol dehydrogenase family)
MGEVLKDRVALVTGGAQGLGEAICRRLAREGCRVAVADLNAEKASQTAASIRERPAIAVPVDVTDETQVQGMVERVVGEFGRLDILVET